MTGNENTNFTLTARQRRLKLIVIVLGVLIVLAFGALVGGFLIKLRGGKSATATPYTADVAVRPGTDVIGTELKDGKLTLKLNTPTGEEIVILDAATGRELGRVRVKPQP
jgi:flagellar basal body-associated protein FliL